jgi:hypothetical protein
MTFLAGNLWPELIEKKAVEFILSYDRSSSSNYLLMTDTITKNVKN